MRYHIQAVGHILDKQVMLKLYNTIKDSKVDITDIRITYPSSTACRDMKNPSLVNFYLDGEGEELEKIKNAVKEVLVDDGCRISLLVEKDKERENVVKIYGNILDQNIMNKIANEIQELFVDIRDIKIEYPSVFPYYQKQRSSECWFLVTGDYESVDKAIQIMKDVAKRENCVINIGPEERFKARYYLNMIGHILDDRIMDKLAQALSRHNVEIEDVKIFYPSTKIYGYRGQPSIAEFSVVGHTEQINSALESIKSFVKQNNCELNFVYHEKTLGSRHLEMRGHIIDNDILNKLTMIISDQKFDVDYVNMKVEYDSIRACADKRGVSILKMDLVGETGDFRDVYNRIRQIAAKEGCEILEFKGLKIRG